MSQRFNLFNAGFCANAPALYYNQVLLSEQYAAREDARVREEMLKFSSGLRDRDKEQAEKLRAAESIARELELKPPALPSSAADYFQWLPQFVELFEQNFPMSRIDHYYFLFGCKLSEILVNLGLATSCLELQARLDRAVDLSKKTDKCIRDNEYILFKLIAPAALLSSEPRQNYFNVYYRTINASFEPFRGIDITQMDGAAMKKLAADLKSYEQQVQQGLTSCVDLLKELGV